VNIESLRDVVRFLGKKQCFESSRTGECDHPACREAREAAELVSIASDLLDPAQPAAAVEEAA
jgi:hypothetical protein